MPNHTTSPLLTASSPRIVVDDREPHEVIVQALQGCGYDSIEVRRLAIGDYMVNESLLVERKSLRDLIASIIDGRLFLQAKRLADADLPAALILEGTAGHTTQRDAMGSNPRGARVRIAVLRRACVAKPQSRRDGTHASITTRKIRDAIG
jgi:ERCC4-type nuclease